MRNDALLLIGRETRTARDVLETHADRLRARGVAESVLTATFSDEPVRELRDELSSISADRTYAVPACVAHSHDTTSALPAALSYVPGDVRYCEPPGRNPAITDLIVRRASASLGGGADASLVLVGRGNSSGPYHRRTAEYHADRIRSTSAYDDVHACFLLQNPAVECARYNVAADRAVAVPLFLSRCASTEEQIPAKLELDRGGVRYADPLGTHELVTDAFHAEFEKQRVLAGRDSDADTCSFVGDRRPVVTDGEGDPR